jgi:DNA-binding GntR family transcriptional regulator
LDVLPLPPVEAARGLSVAVYESLRRAISDGTLPPNYHLRENPLAAHFGVSTTPVREALRRLEREGLVVIRPNRGAVVQAFDLRGAMDLYEVRELLEVEAVRQAAASQERDLSHAERLLAELTEHQAQNAQREALASQQQSATVNGQRTRRARQRNTPQNDGVPVTGTITSAPLWPLDMAFHRALHEIGPNHLLAEMAERTHRQIQAVRARSGMVSGVQPSQSHTEHVALLEAIRKRKPDDAEKIVRKHIRSVRDRVLPALERANAPEASPVGAS